MKFKAEQFFSGKGAPDGQFFSDFKTSLFSQGTTPGIAVDRDVTTGLTVSGDCTTGLLISGDCTTSISITGSATDAFKIATGTFTRGVNLGGTLTTGIQMSACTTGISLTGAMTTGLSITGACSNAGIDFGAGSVTTGSLVDYTGITGKVSGYLFNGSLTTSTITASTLLDDCSCACDHDGAAADTLRMIRRTWSGDFPSATAAPDFAIAEFTFTGTAGADHSKTGTVTGVKVDLSSGTVNDSSVTVYGLYVDANLTNTKSTAVHGIYVDSAQYGVSLGANVTSGINVVDASGMTNLFVFNEAAGCILNVDVSPNDDPSSGGLGADACIRVDINGLDYFIPLFAVELS